MHPVVIAVYLHSKTQQHSWTYEFKPLRHRYWLVRHVLAPLWRHYMQAGVEAAERVAEESEGDRLSLDDENDKVAAPRGISLP